MYPRACDSDNTAQPTARGLHPHYWSGPKKASKSPYRGADEAGQLLGKVGACAVTWGARPPRGGRLLGPAPGLFLSIPAVPAMELF